MNVYMEVSGNLTFPFVVSNEVPEQPVVSPSSGAVFEKRIIEKYIIENGVDPISGKDLRVEDLIEIKSEYSWSLFTASLSFEQVLYLDFMNVLHLS